MYIVFDTLTEFAQARINCEDTRRKDDCSLCPLFDCCDPNTDEGIALMACKIEDMEDSQ